MESVFWRWITWNSVDKGVARIGIQAYLLSKARFSQVHPIAVSRHLTCWQVA